MRTSPVLSSSLTYLSEWVYPAIALLLWFRLIQSALSESTTGWVGVIMGGVVSIITLIWSWPIKFVDVEGDYFTISNYFTSHHIPIAHLTNVKANYYSRTPTITLYFDPPTPFGKRVRIIPPGWLFSRAVFYDIYDFLHSLVSDRTSASNSH